MKLAIHDQATMRLAILGMTTLLASMACLASDTDAISQPGTAQSARASAVSGTSPSPASAALEAKLRALMQASGTATHLQQQIDKGVARAAENAQRMLRESAARLNPDPEFRQRLQQALDTYVATVQEQLATLAQGEAWLALYRQSFTEDEIDQLLKFYRSPLHAREIEVAEEGRLRLDGEVTTQTPTLTAQPTRSYLSTLRSLIRECQCERPPAAASGNRTPTTPLTQ